MLSKIKNLIDKIIFKGSLFLPLPFWQKLIFWISFTSTAVLAFFHQTKTLGKLGLIILTFVIFIKPLVKLFPSLGIFKSFLVIRRQLGQASALFVFGHVLSQVVSLGQLPPRLLAAALAGPKSFQFWGFLGFVLITPLLITSNDFSTRLLKRNWQHIQWVIHPLYIFSLLHYGLQKGYLGVIFSLFVLFTLYGLRLLARLNVTFLSDRHSLSPQSPNF